MTVLLIIQALASAGLVAATLLLYFANKKMAESTHEYLEETAKMREIMEKEFKMKNKPVVGVETIKAIYGIKEAEKFGKEILWNPKEQKFYCELSPIDVTGVRFDIHIKNFTSEPATKISLDTELWIDNTLMPKKVTPEEDKIIMPSQKFTNSATLTKEPLLGALKDKKEIILKTKIKYSDLSEIEDIFEFYMEAKFDGRDITIEKSYFKDKRQE